MKEHKKRTGKWLYFFGALLLSLALLLCGCGREVEPREEDNGEDVSRYIARIAELEAELVALREQQYMESQSKENGADHVSAPSEETAIFHYRVSEGCAYLTGFEGNATLVTVPRTLEGYAVRGIDDRAFEGSQIAAITLPEGLVSVGWFAFYGCEDLIEVSIPASVTSIGYAVFDGCGSVRIVCPAESYAARYAKSYGLRYTEK